MALLLRVRQKQAIANNVTRSYSILQSGSDSCCFSIIGNEIRRGRDSNPRYLAVHRFSRPARSATLSPLRMLASECSLPRMHSDPSGCHNVRHPIGILSEGCRHSRPFAVDIDCYGSPLSLRVTHSDINRVNMSSRMDQWSHSVRSSSLLSASSCG